MEAEERDGWTDGANGWLAPFPLDFTYHGCPYFSLAKRDLEDLIIATMKI
jgi:hypothetical protein